MLSELLNLEVLTNTDEDIPRIEIVSRRRKPSCVLLTDKLARLTNLKYTFHLAFRFVFVFNAIKNNKGIRKINYENIYIIIYL